MSTEFDLPPELANFESHLRRQSLPRSLSDSLSGNEIDRDQLLYQAGWAAAEASRQPSWLWPATSGVLAASVLVLAVLLTMTSGGNQTPVIVANVPPEAEKPAVLPTAELPIEEPSVARSLVSGLVSEHRPIFTPYLARQSSFSKSPFLRMRERALRMEFDEPSSMYWTDDDDFIPTAITARELMQELLGETLGETS